MLARRVFVFGTHLVDTNHMYFVSTSRRDVVVINFQRLLASFVESIWNKAL